MKNAVIVCRKELTEIMRDKKLVIPFFVFPVFFLIVFSFVLRGVMSEPKALERIMGQIFPMFLMVLGIVTAGFSLGIAVESFVGEKERKTFEPLLATPLSDGELFLGKCLAATLMPIASAYVVELLFFGMIAFQFARAHLPFTVPLVQILFIAVLIPAMALLMCSLAVIVSARSSSVKGAGQITAFIIIPLIIFFQNAGSAIMRSGVRMIITLIIVAGIDAFTLYVGSRIFQREKLISSL
jgi:ABC-type Na+ efflux pump permease subunit